MRAHKYPPPTYTVAQYQSWPGDWELIDGYPYAMSPSATLKHQNLANEINSELRLQLKKPKGSFGPCISVTDVDWIVNDYTVLRPDIVIVFDQTDKFITKAPVLIVEVVSPATALKDRHLKYEIYEEQGVKYYLIVDPETKQYNTFVHTGNGYQEQSDLTTFSIQEACAIQVDLAHLLASLLPI